MRLNTPAFWYDTQSPGAKAKAIALSSLGAVYGLGHALHQATGHPRAAGLPVICIGNIVAGGSGKTPVAMALMALIRDSNLARNPCFLTRGYGGTLSGPLLVTPDRKAGEVGDEALLLAARAPTIKSADRFAGACFAKDRGHDLIVMDDGLQNRALEKDISIVVIDGTTGFGNRHLLPAGPLRTPVRSGLQQADAILIVGDDACGVASDIPPGKPVLRAVIDPVPPPYLAPSYYAFCGIARPEKFRRSLADCGLTVSGFRAFPDHFSYRPGDLQSLQAEAQARAARLITTAKDAARLQGFIDPASFDILEIGLRWDPVSHETLARMIGGVKRHEHR